MSGCSMMGIGFGVKKNVEKEIEGNPVTPPTTVKGTLKALEVILENFPINPFNDELSVNQYMKIPETIAFGKLEELDEVKKEKIKATNVCEECRESNGKHKEWCSMKPNRK